MFDYEEYRRKEAHKGAFMRNKGKEKCSVCKFFLCTCQSILKDYGDCSIIMPLKELTMAQKIKNCPHNCSNSTIKCVECYNYNKFKMKVKI